MAATPALAIAHSGAPSLQASLGGYNEQKVFCIGCLVIFWHNFCFTILIHKYKSVLLVAIVMESVAQVAKAVNPII